MKKQWMRGAGVLLPVSSLPSAYGIGTMGKEAYRWIDWLAEAGQSYWQMLPVGPTSFGDSPYQSFSAFAGNPYWIDLQSLISRGLLQKAEVSGYSWYAKEDEVDYAALFMYRFDVLQLAYKRSEHKETKEYRRFLRESKFWLTDYALFMALKRKFQNRPWMEWDVEIRMHNPQTVNEYTEQLKEEMDFWRFCQFEFYQQWNALKKHAHKKGIQLIGDIPLYVSLDSADVWAHAELFELDENHLPIQVAGVPPDCFSEDGQLWGNPLYDWKQMEQKNFCWWRERMSTCGRLYDVIRVDHFIGIVRFYSIPASATTAKTGRWKRGPGRKLTQVMEESVGDAFLIAEDLGVIVPSVRQLINRMGWPGMKILQFAFDGSAQNEYLPHNFTTSNCIVYSGTHDNEPFIGYYKNQKKQQKRQIREYLGADKKKELPDALVRTAYASVAHTAILQMQDILGLDDRARMNLPATVGTNWRWRMTKEQLQSVDVKKIKEYARRYNRAAR